MTEFQLRFFGGLRLTLGEQELTQPLSAKAQGIICYLASTRRPQSRLKLVGMFWGDKPESDALRSLRVDLTKIRKYIAPNIEATRQTIAFVDDGSYLLDTETFENHIRLIQNADGVSARAYLRDIAELYTGDFLEGYQAGDAYDFEEWVLAQRESYRSQALSALDKLVEINRSMQEYEVGITYANQILQIEPWREEAHRSLMWLYMQNGQRSDALRQYELCRTVLEEEVGVEPTPATTDLWLQIKNQATDFVGTQPLPLPESTSPTEKPFQVPPLVPFFCGRDTELAQLTAQLEPDSGVKLVCVSGMGGVGKTSFAVQWAHENKDRFADGVLWANAANDPAMVAEQWAAAYDYDFRAIPKIEDRLLALRDLLSKKRALIIIDDVEVAARVKPLIPTEGASVVVCTTRNADMAYALGAELFNLDVLTSLNGRSLLSSIIGQARVQNEQVAADDICQALQNLPLALAIAGQYLVSRPKRRLATFLSRLQQSALLDVADNEGVVRASFDISWTALDQIQQRVFALVALFNGRSFTAEAMADIAEIDFYVMQDQLDTLSGRSLLIEQGSDYYRQHALLAHFADEKLIDRQPSLLRLVDYYSKFTDANRLDYPKLNEEWDNLDASIQMMADEGLWQTLFRVNQNLNQAWFAQGLFARAKQAYQQAYEGALTIEDEAQIGESLYRQGMALLELGQIDEARGFFEQAIARFKVLSDKVSVSDIQYELARIYIEQAHYELADQLLADSLQVKESLNDLQGLAQIKYRQSRLKFRLADYHFAAKLGNEAVVIQENLDDPLDLIRTLRLLVWTHCAMDEFAQAKECGEQALKLARDIDDRGEIAMALYSLAEVVRRVGDYDEGLNLVEESIQLLEIMGDIGSLGSAMRQKAIILRNQQRCEEAILAAEKAVEFAEKSGERLSNAWAVANIGWSYDCLGQPEKAQKYYRDSKKIGEEIGNDSWVEQINAYIT